MMTSRRDVACILAGAALGCASAYALSALWRRLSRKSKLPSAAVPGPEEGGAREPHIISDGTAAVPLEEQGPCGAGASLGEQGPCAAGASLGELAAEGDDIVCEQFTRNVQMLGSAGQQAVYGSFVVVVGLGGVGSHAAAMLLRSGVGRLRVVDFDQVSLSSLNRHAVAVREDVGTPKALCLQRHFRRILPEAQVEALTVMYSEAMEEQALQGQPDYVLDCIDNIDTKVALLWACKRRGLRVLSSMGAGARADPTRIRVADIMESAVDPLSRAVRLRLRKLMQQQGGQEDRREGEREEEEKGEKGEGKKGEQGEGKKGEQGEGKKGEQGERFLGIEAVFSLERPKSKLLPLPVADGNPQDFQVVPGFRVRVIPVLGPLPAIFGQVMATHVLARLAGLDLQTEPVVALGHEHYRALHQRLVEREELRFGSAAAVEVDLEDVVFVVREVWHGRSARQQQGSVLTGRAMWRSMAHMTLTRWDATRPAAIDNLVLLTFDEADAHDATDLQALMREEPDLYTAVSSRLSHALKLY